MRRMTFAERATKRERSVSFAVRSVLKVATCALLHLLGIAGVAADLVEKYARVVTIHAYLRDRMGEIAPARSAAPGSLSGDPLFCPDPLRR